MSLAEAVRAFAAGRRYQAATLTRWLALEPDAIGALLELAEAIKPSERQLLDLWNPAEEIARRDRLSLAEVLREDEIARLLASGLSRNDKLERIKLHLRRRRWPELTRCEQKIQALIRALDLPANVRITVPIFLEGDQLGIALTVTSPQQLVDTARALLSAASSTEIAEIFAQLDGSAAGPEGTGPAD